MTKVKTFKEWMEDNSEIGSYGNVAEQYAEYYHKAMSEQAEPEEKSDFHYLDFVPKIGAEYFRVNASGALSSVMFDDDGFDLHSLKTGNVFRTEKDAEYYLRMIDLAHEIKQLSYKFTDDEWNDDDMVKFSIAYSHERKSLTVYTGFSYEALRVYFTTIEIAEQAIALFENNDDFLYCLNNGLI